MIFLKEIKEIDSKEVKEEIKELNKEIKEEKHVSDWILIAAVAVIVVILVSLFILKNFQKEEPKTIDDLHTLNLQGKLKPEQGYLYNGYSFVYANGLWYTQVQNKAGTSLFGIPLHYGPNDLIDVPIEGYLNSTLFDSTNSIYITFDPLGSNLNYVALAIGEFDQNIIKAFNKMPIASCDKNETTACSDRPIITCDNTNMPVLYIQQEPEARIIYSNNCIIAQGQGPEIVRAIDRLLLNLYGIMP